MLIKPSLDGILDFYPAATALGKVHDELVSSLIAVRDAVGVRDWNAVQISALRCLGLGSSASQLCTITAVGERGRIAAQLEFMARLEATLDALVEPTEVDLVSALGGIVQEYATASPDTAADFQALIARLVARDATGADVVGALADRQAMVRLPFSFNVTVKSAVAARLRGLLSLYHAEFNRQFSFAGAQAQGILDGEQAVAAAFELQSDQLRSELASQLQNIQIELAATSVAANTAAPASLDHLAFFLERELPLMARRQAVATVVTSALRAAGKGQRAEKLGRRTAETGLLVREAFASYAAAAYISLSLRCPATDQSVHDLMAHAGSVDFERAVSNGTDTELSQLANVSPEDFIEVSGFVQSHKATRLADGKLISRLTLSDPSSGATGDLVAVFVHLAHAGVTPGSFVRASGVFDTAPPGGGSPAVQVDVLSLTKLAAQSFRISFYQIAEPFFAVWRNGANIFWSVGPHLLTDDGTEIDEDASSFGAGELLFVPFVRN